MSENNGHANGSERVTTPTPTAITAPGNGAARERIRVELNQREGMTNEVPPKAPAVPVPIIDDKLDESDVAVTVTVRVHSRTRVIANNCEFKTTVYEGMQDEMRGLLFQAMEQLMTEARQAVSVKFNRAVPIADIPPNERKRAGEEEFLIKEPIPPWPANQPAPRAPDFPLHVPPELPELDPSGIPGMQGTGLRR